VPVQKFRSIEDMNGARLVAASGEDGFNRFLRHSARMWRMSPRIYPRGVFRFRSGEEAQASRQRPAGVDASRESTGGSTDGQPDSG